MITAYLDAMRRYASFGGRSTRQQYWLYLLCALLFQLVCLGIDIAVFGSDTDVFPFAGIFNLVHLIPTLAVSVRRLHDTDRSGGVVLLGIIPLLGGLILTVFACQRSTAGPNRYGPPARDETEDDALAASQRPLRADFAPGRRQPDFEPAFEREPTLLDPAFFDEPNLPATAPLGVAPVRSATPIAELERIHRLHASGAITDAEYADLKARLLGRS